MSNKFVNDVKKMLEETRIQLLDQLLVLKKEITETANEIDTINATKNSSQFNNNVPSEQSVDSNPSQNLDQNLNQSLSQRTVEINNILLLPEL